MAASIWMLAKTAGILKLLPILLGTFVLLSALMKLQYSMIEPLPEEYFTKKD